MGLSRWLSGKESASQCRRHKRCGFDPGSGRSPGVGMATHSSILAWEISMDRGAWQATVYGVAKSWMWLSTHARPNTVWSPPAHCLILQHFLHLPLQGPATLNFLRSSTQPFDARLLHILPSACHPLILSLKIYFPGRALLTSWTRIGHCCGPPHRNLSYSFPSTHYIRKFPKGLIQPSTYLTIISRIPTMC